MKFFKSKPAAYLTDAFCALLLSTAAFLVLSPYFGFELNFWRCLLVLLLDTFMVFVLSRRWWILPALLLFSAVTLFSVVSFLGLTDALVSRISGFINWYLSGLPEDSMFYLPVNFLFLQALLALPVAGVSLLFFRKLFFFLLCLLLF